MDDASGNLHRNVHEFAFSLGSGETSWRGQRGKEDDLDNAGASDTGFPQRKGGQ